MSITVEAIYENGFLKPIRALPLKELEKVVITVRSAIEAGVIPCSDPQLIEWAATDAELDFPPSPEDP